MHSHFAICCHCLIERQDSLCFRQSYVYPKGPWKSCSMTVWGVIFKKCFRISCLYLRQYFSAEKPSTEMPIQCLLSTFIRSQVWPRAAETDKTRVVTRRSSMCRRISRICLKAHSNPPEISIAFVNQVPKVTKLWLLKFIFLP